MDLKSKICFYSLSGPFSFKLNHAAQISLLSSAFQVRQNNLKSSCYKLALMSIYKQPTQQAEHCSIQQIIFLKKNHRQRLRKLEIGKVVFESPCVRMATKRGSVCMCVSIVRCASKIELEPERASKNGRLRETVRCVSV